MDIFWQFFFVDIDLLFFNTITTRTGFLKTTVEVARIGKTEKNKKIRRWQMSVMCMCVCVCAENILKNFH